MMVTWVVSKRSLVPCWSSGPKLVVFATLTFLMMIPYMIPVLIHVHHWDYVQDPGVISCPESHIETPITSHNLDANSKPPFYKVLRSPIVTRPGITNCTLTFRENKKSTDGQDAYNFDPERVAELLKKGNYNEEELVVPWSNGTVELSTLKVEFQKNMTSMDCP